MKQSNLRHAALMAFVAALYVATGRPCPAAGSCSAFEIHAVCCPSACAAKRSTRWTEADGMLRGCMASLGCGVAETSQADVFMRCDCR